MADVFSFDDLPQTNPQVAPTNSGQFSFDDIAHINASPVVPTAQQSSVGIGQHLMNALNNIGQGGLDVLSGVAKAGMGIENTPHNIVNMFSPRIAANIPTSPINSNDINQLFGTQNPGMYGKFLEGFGQYGPFMAGGEALGASGLLGDAATGAAYGATQTQNPLSGGIKGAVLNTALSAIPGGIGLAAKGLNYLKPGDYADQIVNQLGQGRSLEDNAQSLAQDINNAFKQRINEGSAQYQPVFNAVGNNSIYQGINQLETRLPANNFKNIDEIIDYVNDSNSQDLENVSDLKEYLQDNHGMQFNSNKGLLNFFNSYPATINTGIYNKLDPSIINSYDRNLTTLNNQFIATPTFENAHLLQSQLGSSIRKLQAADAKGNLSIADTSTMQGYQEAQNALRTDMNNFLVGKNPNLANQYQMATQNWAQNVAPYFDNSKIAQMAKGELTNPSSLQSIFKNPEPEIQKVVSDLPDDAKNRVLYSMLGKTSATKSPENLVNAFKQLDQQGLSSYVTPSLADQISQLGTKIKMRNVAQGATGAGLALTFLPHVMSPEMVGAASIGGGYLGPMLARMGQRMMPNTNISLSQALLNAYPGVRAAVIPNVIGGQ